MLNVLQAIVGISAVLAVAFYGAKAAGVTIKGKPLPKYPWQLL